MLRFNGPHTHIHTISNRSGNSKSGGTHSHSLLSENETNKSVLKWCGLIYGRIGIGLFTLSIWQHTLISALSPFHFSVIVVVFFYGYFPFAMHCYANAERQACQVANQSYPYARTPTQSENWRISGICDIQYAFFSRRHFSDLCCLLAPHKKTMLRI